ncbi:hypothetical protein Y032_0015g2772 [Ancylostoma ceylanicum]|uniref:Fungal lipase-type domain-containing protein n=1 Tax=Ancylostoma ceylanicum TaxID=53326 RepID=A0A016V7N8_9BILA|nr:hypothetical protein Y032_0015g2772 [Ancylostoma ceylanicum]
MLRLTIVLVVLTLVPALAFYPRKTNYNEQTARMLLHMSSAAYGNLQQLCLNRAFASPHIVLTQSNVPCDEKGNTCESYTAVSDADRHLTIVFRGSRTTSQIIMQGLKYLEPVEFYGLGNINRYFADGVAALWPPIGQVLRDPRFTNYAVTFTGHSLGGALAAVAAARTVAEGLRPGHLLTVYTFGEPRVGNVNFAMNFNRVIPNSYRVVFRQDIVPHLPPCVKTENIFGLNQCDPSSPFTAYHHGTEIWYPYTMSPGSTYVECVGEPRGEDATCSNNFNFMLSQLDNYTFDHRHYFDIEVPAFGQAGCPIA